MLAIIWGINMSDDFIRLLSFIFPAITLTILAIDAFSNKKTTFIGSLLFLASLAALLILNVQLAFFQDLNYRLFVSLSDDTWNFIVLAVAFLSTLISLIFYIIHAKEASKKQLVLRTAKIYEQTNVLAYISRKGKLIQISKRIYDLVLNPQKELALKAIEIESESFGPKEAIKTIVKYPAKINEALHYKFVLMNNLEIILKMVKKEIIHKDKVIGYILLDPAPTSEYQEDYNDVKRSFYIYLDLIDEPVAYYDEEEKAYIASRNLLQHFQLQNNVISFEYLRSLVHKDDLPIFDNREIEDNKYQQYQYRLNTKNGYAWFEEGSGSFFGKNYIITKKIATEEISAIDFGTYKNYVSEVENNISNNRAFTIVLVNLHSIPQLIQEQGKDFANLVMNKYFAKISGGVLKDRVQLYKVANLEYALVIEGEEYYELLVRDLYSNTSDLLIQDITVNKIKTTVLAHVGMVFSKELPVLNARKMMKIVFDTMKEASDPEFLKDYSIYQSKEDVKLDYTLLDLGIDFEADDLSVFMEDVKK